MRALAVTLAAFLVPVAAGAEEKRSRPWELDAGASYVVLGPAEHQTGGAMPRIAARRRWELGRLVEVALGAHVGAFGFGDEPRWIGVIGGPSAAIGVRPARWLGISLEVDVDAGRIPACNPWGLCLRYVGLFPAARLGMTWYSDGVVSLGASGAIRYVDTLGWSGVGGELGAVGRVAF